MRLLSYTQSIDSKESKTWTTSLLKQHTNKIIIKINCSYKQQIIFIFFFIIFKIKGIFIPITSDNNKAKKKKRKFVLRTIFYFFYSLSLRIISYLFRYLPPQDKRHTRSAYSELECVQSSRCTCQFTSTYLSYKKKIIIIKKCI